MPDGYLEKRDPKKALDYFRSLPEEDQLTAVFAETSVLRYELRLIEELIGIFRRLFWPLIAALVLLVGLAVSNYLVNRGNHDVIQRVEECTTPGTPCTNRLRDGGGGQLCAVVLLQNDNRIVNHYDPGNDGTVDTLPVPKGCSP